VAHTPEQRDKHALCGAKKKSGELCRAFAGQGTDHPGVGRCKYHLGATKNHRVNAVKQEAQRRAIQFGQKIPVEPTEALLTVLYLSAGHLEFVRSELTAQQDGTTFEAQVLGRQWNEERERVARIAKMALDAGVAERQVQLAERYGHQLAEMLRAVFDELELTAAQRERLPDLLRRHLAPADAGRPALTAVAGR